MGFGVKTLLEKNSNKGKLMNLPAVDFINATRVPMIINKYTEYYIIQG
jgi:hypothetical protein